jgi:hypothetical protein
MKFKRSTHFYIAINIMDSVFTKTQPLNYEKWVEFVDKNQDNFIWYENTKSGLEAKANIDKVPEDFKERVFASLNKVRCFKEFDEEKGYYNINCGFSSANNWISIGFERTPKLEDLKIFVEMAKYLDALLLKDGTEIIDEKVIEELEKGK